MGVRNEYANAITEAGKLDCPAFVQGQGQIFGGVATFEIAAADDDASIIRIFKNVPAEVVILSLRLSCDALTGMTDVDCGLYDPDERGGAVIDKDILADGLNPSAGYSRILGLDCLKDVDLANAQKRLYQIAGHTFDTKKPGYDIALTFNTIGSGAGTIMVVGLFLQG